jgi:hypothetical protein
LRRLLVNIITGYTDIISGGSQVKLVVVEVVPEAVGWSRWSVGVDSGAAVVRFFIA